MPDDFIEIPDPFIIEGVEELAKELGVAPHVPGAGTGFVLVGRSGNQYQLVALLAAHIRMMRDAAKGEG